MTVSIGDIIKDIVKSIGCQWFLMRFSGSRGNNKTLKTFDFTGFMAFNELYWSNYKCEMVVPRGLEPLFSP